MFAGGGVGGCEQELVQRGNTKSKRKRENLFGDAHCDESRILRVGLGGWRRDEDGTHNKQHSMDVGREQAVCCSFVLSVVPASTSTLSGKSCSGTIIARCQ